MQRATEYIIHQDRVNGEQGAKQNKIGQEIEPKPKDRPRIGIVMGIWISARGLCSLECVMEPLPFQFFRLLQRLSGIQVLLQIDE